MPFVLAVGLAATGGRALPSAQEEQWRSQIRRTLFVRDPLPALTPETFSRFQPEPDVTAERVPCGSESDRRVPAVLYLTQAHQGKIPARIVVNGHGGDKYSWYAFYSGILYGRAGGAVLIYDPAGEGERNLQLRSGTRAHSCVGAGEAVALTRSARGARAPWARACRA